MEKWFTNLIEITLSVSVLIVLLMALTPLLRRQYVARWRYWAWLAVAVRLLIPLNFSLPQAPLQLQIPEQTVLSLPAQQQAAQTVIVENLGQQAAANPAPEAAATPITLFEIACWIWLAGLAAFLLWHLGSYWYYARQIRRWSRPASNPAVLECAAEVMAQTGLKKLLPVFICPKVAGPMVMGLLRPRLLLPQETYAGQSLWFILKHEMVHVKRHDIWYKLLLLLANAVHWFNPLVWWMSYQAGQDIEIACDDEVVRGLDAEGRSFYGSTILDVVRKGGERPAVSTYFSGGVKAVKKRLGNLFDQRNKRKGVLALCVRVVLAGSVGIFAACTAPEQPGQESDVSSQDETNWTTVPMEVDLGTMGHLQFEIPSVFEGKLEAVVRTEEEIYQKMIAVEIWLKDVPADEQLYTINLMTQADFDSLAENNQAQPVVLFQEDGYVCGSWIVPYNPVESVSAEYPEAYELVQQHVSDLWQTIADTISWEPAQAEFLQSYLPFAAEDVTALTIEQVSYEKVLSVSLSGQQAQNLCESIGTIQVSPAESADPITGSKRVYQFTLHDGTVHTVEEMGDITLDGQLLCCVEERADQTPYPQPWQYHDVFWTEYLVDPVTGERMVYTEQMPPEFYAKAFLNFEMEGVTGTRYAQEGDWQAVAQFLDGCTLENLQTLLLTSAPTDRTDRVEMSQEQAQAVLDAAKALRGDPWPYDPDEPLNPPTGGSCGISLVRDNGDAVQITFNGSWLIVAMSGESQMIRFDCEEPQANQNAYELFSLFEQIVG